jgi:glycosyltransferase involved in cell wall biosynthesis
MLLLVSNIPAPYRIPLFNAIHKVLKAQQKQFKVVFATRSYAFRKWNVNEADFEFDYAYLNENNNSKKEQTSFSYKGLFTQLRACKPTTVVVSGFSIATVIVAVGKLVYGYKLVLWAGTTNNPNRKISVLKTFYRRALTLCVDEYIVYGSAAKEYILTLDKRNKAISLAYNTVALNTYYKPILSTDYSTLQLLYVGNFTIGKQVHLLIEIAEQLKILNTNFHLTLIGSGETFESIETLVNEHNLGSYVTLKPHLQQQQLLPYYHKSHVFLFPSQYDIWGLVVNEAMAAGLCVFSSVKAGATRDLIQHNTTGFAVDFTDTNAVAQGIYNTQQSPETLTNIRIQGQHYITQHITIDAAAQCFVNL